MSDAPGDDWDDPVPLVAASRPEFPTGYLPATVREMVEGVSVATQTPLALAALTAIGVLSAAVAGRFQVRVRSDRTESAGTFTASVLGSGEGKSTVFALMDRPLREWEAAAADRFAAEIACEQSRTRSLELRLQHLERQASDPTNDGYAAACRERDEVAEQLVRARPREPFQLIVGDATQQAVVEVMAAQGGRCAIISDEASSLFDIATGRYASDGRSNIEVYLQAYTGTPIPVNRKNRRVQVPRPALTIVTTMQPSVLDGLAQHPELITRGMLARFLWALPRSRLGHRSPDSTPLDDGVRQRYERLVRCLCDAREERDDRGQIVAISVPLTDEAQRSLRDLRATIEPELLSGGRFAHVREWASRIEGNAIRVALALHLTRVAESALIGGSVLPTTVPSVDGDSVSRAVALTWEFFVPHALAVFERLGARGEVTKAEAVLAWIERTARTRFSQRDVLRGNPATFARSAETAEPLRVLEERGYIRLAGGADAVRPGRRPSPEWLVNPRLTRFARPSGSWGSSTPDPVGDAPASSVGAPPTPTTLDPSWPRCSVCDGPLSPDTTSCEVCETAARDQEAVR